jgi:hypothetical protein
MHGSACAQFRVASVLTQLKRQPSQPSPFTVLRSSHSSPGSTIPLPQLAGWQAPDRQNPLTPASVHAPPSFVAAGVLQR